MFRLDKIDGDIAIITLKEQTIKIDSSRLPVDAKEGDELDITMIQPEEPIVEPLVEAEVIDEVTETAIEPEKGDTDLESAESLPLQEEKEETEEPEEIGEAETGEGTSAS